MKIIAPHALKPGSFYKATLTFDESIIEVGKYYYVVGIPSFNTDVVVLVSVSDLKPVAIQRSKVSQYQFAEELPEGIFNASQLEVGKSYEVLTTNDDFFFVEPGQVISIVGESTDGTDWVIADASLRLDWLDKSNEALFKEAVNES